MKNLKFIKLFIVLLLLVSCDNSENEIKEVENFQSKQSIEKLNAENDLKNKKELFDFLGTNDYVITDNSRKVSPLDVLEINGVFSKEDDSANLYRVYGPFTATMQTTVSGNFNMQLTSSSGFATGIYSCRIRTFLHTAVLPGNALPYSNSVTPELYSNPYNQTIGRIESSTLSPSGNKIFTVTTKQLLVDYNILGQYIWTTLPFVVPVNPGVEVKYSYILI